MKAKIFDSVMEGFTRSVGGHRPPLQENSFGGILSKTSVLLPMALASFLIFSVAGVFGATNDVSGMLQKGLFEEEADRNLDAAIRAYQAVIAQTDKDHQFAATAVFRLGECLRKQGKTNEANVQYQRVLREFADQAELVKLSREYVGSAIASDTNHASTFQDRLRAITKSSDEMEEDTEIKRIQTMIRDSPDLINANDGGGTPLIQAIKKNQLKVAGFLLDAKADTEGREQETSKTALMFAVQRGNAEMVHLLLSHGADFNASRRVNDQYQGWTPLHYAAENGFKAIAETLLDHGANVNAQDQWNEAPLHFAAQKGFLAFAETLLARGAKVDPKDRKKATPLHLAVAAGNRAMVELLISKGADVNNSLENNIPNDGRNTSDWTGTTPLLRAAQLGNKTMVELLLANKAEVNCKDVHGDTPLLSAVRADKRDLVDLFLAHGADVNSANTYGLSPLLAACSVGSRPEVVKALLEHGANVEARAKNNNNQTPLQFAISQKQNDVAALLLDNKADPNASNDQYPKAAALFMALFENQSELMKLLLEHHADANAAGKSGITPLHCLNENIAQMNDTDRITMADLLPAHGAKVDAQDEKGQSPLHWAVRNNYKAMVEYLVAHGADVNLKDNDGNTPLDLRVTGNNGNRPGFVVNAGTFPNSPGQNAPLSYQWQFGNNSEASENKDEITQLLREHGAVTELERGTLRVVSKGWTSPTVLLKRDPDGHNHFTLFELLKMDYREGASPGTRYSESVPFPDFANVRIWRLEQRGATNGMKVDLKDALESGDCSKDVPLKWGDVVEIPELDHNINEQWSVLPDNVRSNLDKCLRRSVEIIVKGQTTKVTLTTGFTPGGSGLPGFMPPLPRPARLPNSAQSEPVATGNTNGVEEATFWLNQVVRGANVLLSSSDVTRVRVKRKERDGQKPEEMVFNLDKLDGVNNLWLEDGDVIEVPEKP